MTSLDPLELLSRLAADRVLRADGFTIDLAVGRRAWRSYGPGQPVPPLPAAYGAMVARVTHGWNVRLIFEPGRLIVANAGVLLARVVRIKPGEHHPWVIVDAAMNDLMRVALYDAYHQIVAVAPTGQRMTANVVGPVCESGDTFALAREMDQVEAGDLVVRAPEPTARQCRAATTADP